MKIPVAGIALTVDEVPGRTPREAEGPGCHVERVLASALEEPAARERPP